MDPNDVDIGDVYESDRNKAGHEFRFQNEGGKTLIIEELSSSCACAEAKVSTFSVVPGEFARLSVKLAITVEGPFMECVRMRTNDPNSPIAFTTIKGNYVPLVSIGTVPASCDFEAVQRNRECTKVIKLLNPRWNPRQQLLEINAIKVNPSNILSARLSKDWYIDDESVSRGVRVCEISVSLRHDFAPWHYEGDILLVCDPKDVRIPVSFTVPNSVTGSPASCFFSLSKKNKRLSKTIWFQAYGGDKFTITQVSADAPWLKYSVENQSRTPMPKHSINVTVDADDLKKAFVKAYVKVSGFANNKMWEQSISIVCTCAEE